MKKTLKILSILFVAISIIALSTSVFAAVDPSGYDGNGSTVNTASIDSFGQNIVTLISTVASIASVIVLIVLGIKYMMGSAEEKAEYKKTLLPYIIGAVMVFAASSIAGVIFNFASGGLA